MTKMVKIRTKELDDENQFLEVIFIVDQESDFETLEVLSADMAIMPQNANRVFIDFHI